MTQNSLSLYRKWESDDGVAEVTVCLAQIDSFELFKIITLQEAGHFREFKNLAESIKELLFKQVKRISIKVEPVLQ